METPCVKGVKWSVGDTRWNGRLGKECWEYLLDIKSVLSLYILSLFCYWLFKYNRIVLRGKSLQRMEVPIPSIERESHRVHVHWHSSHRDMKPSRTIKRCKLEMIECRRVWCRDEPWPYLTQAYFWPAVNKRPTRLWPGYFLTWAKDFFWPEGKKIEKFVIFRGNFPKPNSNHRWLTLPDPCQKFLTWTHHYCVWWSILSVGRVLR